MEGHVTTTQGVLWNKSRDVTILWCCEPIRVDTTYHAPRVQVVLVDHSRQQPHYLGDWHLFLPSEV